MLENNLVIFKRAYGVGGKGKGVMTIRRNFLGLIGLIKLVLD